MLPQASVSPAAMRATRALLRRRRHLVRTRAALLTHVQQTTSQDHVPEMGTKIADKANRDGVAERLPDPAVPKSIEVDLALLGHEDDLRRELALAMVTTAKHHHAHTLYWLQTVPGIGTILSLGLVYAIHDRGRFPRVQDGVSYGRVVTCAKASAGKREGTSGTQMGNASLTWAFFEAAVLLLRHHPAGHTSLGR
jgi:transposase